MTPQVELRVISDRVLLLALDQLYRKRMKLHEASELLRCAESVASAIGLEPSQVPIEGYYTESEQLSRYFLLMRGLQATPDFYRSRLEGLPEFRRLLQVATSPMFGTPTEEGFLLPTGRDPLYWALKGLRAADCTVPEITGRAYREAMARTTDCSLVGLAALSEDAVVLAALRESVVLYAALETLSPMIPSVPRYVWNVSPVVAERTERFVQTFFDLFADRLPRPHPDNAELFWDAYDEEDLLGRCVRIAIDDSRRPERHYHWAVRRGPEDDLVVHDFWDEELWTTERYKREHEAWLW